MKKKNNWTIMIYHSGDSDLGEEFVWAMKEMQRVGTSQGVEVVALMDSISPDLWQFNLPPGSAPSGDDQNGIFHKTIGEKVTTQTLAEKAQNTGRSLPQTTKAEIAYGVDMASAEVLSNFVWTCVKEHPAKHYMLILSGHGDGIVGRTLLLDRGAGSFMTVSTLNTILSTVLKEAESAFTAAQHSLSQEEPQDQRDSKIAILGLDACAMMTAEIAHLLNKSVKYMVASQGYMTTTGWPYHKILEFLQTKPNADPQELAKAVVRQVIHYYTDYARAGLSVDLAAYSLNEEDWWGVADDIKRLSKALRREIQNESRQQPITNAVVAAHWHAQSYANEQYVDLWDFCERLKEAAPKLANECQAIIERLEALLVTSRYAGAGFQHSHGVSLYFPWVATDKELSRYMVEYKPDGSSTSTLFNKATQWGDFLKSFINATRRQARVQVNGERIDIPPNGYRDHIDDAAHRNGVPSDSRNGVMTDTRGNLIIPKFKNPALHYYEYSGVEDPAEGPKTISDIDVKQGQDGETRLIGREQASGSSD